MGLYDSSVPIPPHADRAHIFNLSGSPGYAVLVEKVGHFLEKAGHFRKKPYFFPVGQVLVV
jgi:hypothetical protein